MNSVGHSHRPAAARREPHANEIVLHLPLLVTISWAVARTLPILLVATH